jgi:NADH:ubiquinone oxidoreductase subunit E
MLRLALEKKEIRICSGAGCKAWGAQEIMRELDAMKEILNEVGVAMVEVSCFKSCGGGACLRTADATSLKKFRTPQQAVDFLLQTHDVSFAEAVY